MRGKRGDGNQGPDWKTAETVIVERSIKCIEVLAKHTTDVFSCFAFNCNDFDYGDVLICFDTIGNSLLHAKRHEARVLKIWDGMSRANVWDYGESDLKHDRLCSFNPHTSDFAYSNFSRLHFTDWLEYFDDDLATLGDVFIMLHNVVRRLVTSRCFNQLTIASPFYIGVEFVGEPILIIMRTLNWPAHEGPQV